jgi:beta-fructofuranosidase
MAARHGVCATPLPLAPGESLQLHVFLDRSVVEVYANSRICLASRIYPERADSLGFGPFAERGDAPAVVLDVWEMKPIWKDAP